MAHGIGLVASPTKDVPLADVDSALRMPSSATNANTRTLPLVSRIADASATWPLLEPKVAGVSAVPIVDQPLMGLTLDAPLDGGVVAPPPDEPVVH